MTTGFMKEEVLTRAEFLGGLIKEARLKAGISVDDCAGILGSATADYELIESGGITPSLPELEVLAIYLKVPMSYFFGNTSGREHPTMDFDDYLSLRRMMIGTRLGQVRIRAKLTVDDLADETGIPTGKIVDYESGTHPIPYFELETLAAKLDASIKVFVDDSYGPLAENEAERELEKRFGEWTPQMKLFIADSRNLAYLETAMRLSEMDADKLRSIAEGILEITL